MPNIFFTPESRALGLERLLTLYALIPGLPHHGFNMNVWRYIQDEGQEFNVTDRTLIAGVQPTPAGNVRMHCGTSACAMGWAAAYPPFKEVGLGYSSKRQDISLKAPGKSTLYEWDAISAFFSLPKTFARYLFVDAEYYPDFEELTGQGKRLLASFKHALGRTDGCTVYIADAREAIMYRILIFLAMEGHRTPAQVADAWAQVKPQIQSLAPRPRVVMPPLDIGD